MSSETGMMAAANRIHDLEGSIDEFGAERNASSKEKCSDRVTACHSPVPSFAFRWTRRDAEKLNIFCVPLHESQYLLHLQDSSSPLVANSATAEGSNINRYTYGYDYKTLLKDVIKPSHDARQCKNWWDGFEKALKRNDVMEIIDENLVWPDIDKETSSAFSSSISTNPTRPVFTANGADVDSGGPYKEILRKLFKDVQTEEEKLTLKLLRQKTVTSLLPEVHSCASKAFDFLEYRLTLFCYEFLETVGSLLERHAVYGQAIDENCFENLFQVFARIFFLELRQASKRSMNIFGEVVSSTPDLRSEVSWTKRQQISGGMGGLVITVAKVKLDARDSKNISSSNLHPSRPSDDSEHNPVETDLPDDLLGRHTAELLIELSNTALRNYGNESIFGMIVQYTRVRVTCLKMSQKHLQILQHPEPRDLDDSIRAEIHYSLSYDMFNRKDREHLVYILLLFAYLRDQDFLLR